MKIDDQKIREIIESRLGPVQAVYRFGSTVDGWATNDSDIDIAVLTEGGLAPDQRWAVAEEISLLTNRDVDIIDLRQASTVLRSQVLARGEVVYRSIDPAVEAFEDFVYADYARLNEQRAGILRDVSERGRTRG